MSFTESVDDLVAANENGLLGAHPTWARVRLAEVCSILNGFPFPSKKFKPTGGIPLIRIRDVLRERTETQFIGEFDPAFIVEHGDVLVGMDGDFNCAIWSGERGLLNQRVCKLTPDERFYDARLLVHVLQGYLEAINAKTSAITVKHLSSKTIAEIPLPLLPRQEQVNLADAIESYFTRLDDAVASLERVQRNLKRYRASVLKAAVEGRLVPTEAELARAEGRDYEPASALLERILGERRRHWEDAELAKSTAKGKVTSDDRRNAKNKEPVAPDTKDLPKLAEGWCWASVDSLLREPLRNGHSAKRAADGGVRTLTLSAVTERDFSERNTKLTAANPDQVQDLWIEPGDIFIERSNTPELVGTAALYRGAREFAIFPDLLIRVRPAADLMPDYLEAVLRSHRARNFFRRSAKGIAGSMPKINQETVSRLAVPVPPASEQARIVAEIDRLLSIADDAEVAVSGSKIRGHRIRHSILKWAFEGRLVDQDPTDEPASVLLQRIRAERESFDGKKPTTPRRRKTGSTKA